jgi:hypothetical protein
MTYNFDPERWFAIEEDALAERRRKDELDAAAFEAAMQDLVRRYEEMLVRLDMKYDYRNPDGSNGG